MILKLNYMHEWWNRLIFSTYIFILMLSVINIFSIPLPIVHSSLALISILSGPLIAWFLMNIRKTNQFTFLDIIALVYLQGILLSSIFTLQIYSLAELRTMTTAVIIFLFTRHYNLSSNQKRIIFLFLGAESVILASLSLMYLVFPYGMTEVATIYFYGDRSHSIVADYQRGRLAPWGNVISTFPVLFANLQKLPAMISALFLFLISSSIFLSGSRWLLLCFLLALAVLLKHLTLKKTARFIKVALSLSIILSLLMTFQVSRSTFNYNVVDRLLLKSQSRDIVETAGRTHLYEQALLLFSSSPWLGIGMGNYLNSDNGTNALPEIPAHNIFLTVLAEQGIVGLLFIITIIGLSLRIGLTAPGKNKLFPILVAAILFLLQGQFLSVYINNYIWLFFLLALLSRQGSSISGTYEI